MSKARISALLAALLLSACASERVVLLPSADGSTGAVVVRDAKGEYRLDKPYEGTVRRLGGNRPESVSAEVVNETFGAALAALPPRASSYILYFQPGGNQLTPDSQTELKRMLAVLASHPAPEVRVIGHTDSVGNARSNEALSMQRAEAVRDQLVKAGVAASSIEAVGRGERELLVLTADEVDEPRNRRVEINLR